jgi:hypothetical protein
MEGRYVSGVVRLSSGDEVPTKENSFTGVQQASAVLSPRQTPIDLAAVSAGALQTLFQEQQKWVLLDAFNVS